MWTIRYLEKVLSEDVPRLSPEILARLRGAVEGRLAADPMRYGLPLRRNLSGCRKLRVGDHRIIFAIRGNEILIVAMRHRKDVYESAAKRVL